MKVRVAQTPSRKPHWQTAARVTRRPRQRVRRTRKLRSTGAIRRLVRTRSGSISAPVAPVKNIDRKKSRRLPSSSSFSKFPSLPRQVRVRRVRLAQEAEPLDLEGAPVAHPSPPQARPASNDRRMPSADAAQPLFCAPIAVAPCKGKLGRKTSPQCLVRSESSTSALAATRLRLTPHHENARGNSGASTRSQTNRGYCASRHRRNVGLFRHIS